MAPSAPTLRLVKDAAATVPLPIEEDDRLVRAFLQGDQRAFEALVVRHQPLVLALLRRYASAPDEARDLGQRVFLRAFQATARSFSLASPGLLPFRAWLVRIAINLGKNQVRDRKKRPTVTLEDAGDLEGTGPTQAALLERKQREARVKVAVLTLPRREREVFTLRTDTGLPFAEVGELLGITENNAKVTFHHAVKRLQAAMAQQETER